MLSCIIKYNFEFLKYDWQAPKMMGNIKKTKEVEIPQEAPNLFLSKYVNSYKLYTNLFMKNTFLA